MDCTRAPTTKAHVLVLAALSERHEMNRGSEENICIREERGSA